ELNDATTGDTNNYLIDATGAVRPMTHVNLDYDNYYFDGSGFPELDPELPANTPFAAVPFDPTLFASNKFAQEAWARYDRQRLARDIYVLLYTLGAPDTDGVNPFDPTSAPFPP